MEKLQCSTNCNVCESHTPATRPYYRHIQSESKDTITTRCSSFFTRPDHQTVNTENIIL